VAEHHRPDRNGTEPAAGNRRGAPLSGAIGTVALPLLVFLGLALILELAKRAGWLPVTVPAPSEIAGALAVSGADLLYHMGPTVLAAAGGYAIAALIAFLLAALAAGWPRSEETVLKLGIIVDSIPLIALTPILMVFIGTGMTSRIVIATIAALFPLLVGAVQGFKAVERNAAELFHVLSARPWQKLRKLALPTALPYLFAALKIAAPLAILGALIAEWVNADRGLGIMMVYALFSFNVPLVWLTIIAVAALAMSAYGLVALAERLVVRWETAGQGRGL
jgi:ABC-type nitrate/sulfonate/bicarbonate transport system permease component